MKFPWRKKPKPADEVFGEWAGQRFALTEQSADAQAPPTSRSALAITESAIVGEDVPATVDRLVGGLSPEVLESTIKEDLQGLLELGLVRLEPVG